jgi:23S rRNA (uracil1939-C5)-methyltransferase
MLRETLRRIGGLEVPAGFELIPSPQDLGYRHRARLHCDLRGGDVRLGFYHSGSRRIASLASCPILTPSLNTAIAGLLQVLNESWKPAALRTADLASDYSDVTVRLSLEGPQGLLVPPRQVAETLNRQAAGTGIDLILPGMKDRPLAITGDEDGPRALRSAFTQVNLQLNGRLVEEVVRLAAPGPGNKVLDLFCGTGNYSLSLASAGAEVLGIDSSGPAVASAVANARRMKAGGITFRRGQVVQVLRELGGTERPFAAIVVNPPRQGCRETVPGMLALAPRRVVMVSCDPATFARDAALLVEGGYRLEEVKAFDLFPQTFHFETVALFTR